MSCRNHPRTPAFDSSEAAAEWMDKKFPDARTKIISFIRSIGFFDNNLDTFSLIPIEGVNNCVLEFSNDPPIHRFNLRIQSADREFELAIQEDLNDLGSKSRFIRGNGIFVRRGIEWKAYHYSGMELQQWMEPKNLAKVSELTMSRARARLQIGRVDDGINDLREILSTWRGGPEDRKRELMEALATAHALKGNYIKAIDILKESLELELAQLDFRRYALQLQPAHILLAVWMKLAGHSNAVSFLNSQIEGARKSKSNCWIAVAEKILPSLAHSKVASRTPHFGSICSIAGDSQHIYQINRDFVFLALNQELRQLKAGGRLQELKSFVGSKSLSESFVDVPVIFNLALLRSGISADDFDRIRGVPIVATEPQFLEK